MTDKEKLERIKKLADAMYNVAFNIITYVSRLKKVMYDYYQFVIQEFHKEEPVSNTIPLCGLSGNVGIEEAVKETEEYKKWQGDPERQQSFIDFAKFDANYKHHTSKDLEEASRKYANNEEYGDDVYFAIKAAFKEGAQWQKKHICKPADGNELPELDREVIVLYQRYPLEDCEYSVGFGHRPKEYWDGKNIETGEITRYYPKRYDKGGWNIPDAKYWLDCELPTKE